MSDSRPTDVVADDHIVVHVSGKLDVVAAKGFEARLTAHIESPQRLIVVDFTDCSYVSSAGLRSILIAAKKANSTNKTLVLAGMNPMVREVFRVSGFDKMLTIEPDATTAISLH